MGVFSTEGALSVVQSKKTRGSSRGAVAPRGPAFPSASTTSSVQATDVVVKQRWGLNEEQLAAVEADAAHVRVVAGPGSGKTRVLTHRIAHMIGQFKAPPCNILCVTFTNKAAQELCERLNNLLDEDVSSQLMVGTIHSVCARILRSSPQISDYSLNGNYIIYDENNSQQVVKRILQEALDTSDVMNVSIGRECFNDDADLERIAAQNLDESVMQRSQIANCEVLSRCKFLAENAPARLALLDFLARYNKKKPEPKKRKTVPSDAVKDLLHIIRRARLHNMQAFIARKNRRDLPPTPDSLDAFAFKMAEIYELELRRSNAADFDDLMYLVARLLHNNPHILQEYRNKWRHVLVDEFQDIDGIQYELVRLFSIRNSSLFVVGDTDQAIYGWRGADAALMQYALDRDFPQIITFKLIRNYRSSSNILKAASALLGNDPNNWQMASTKVLNLVPMKPPGEPICIQKLRSPVEEANFIAYEIQRLVNTNLATWCSFAILFRTHVQSFFIESSLSSLQIPYSVIGSRPLYSHKEIQYVLAYLHLISNQENEMALECIINVPPRGIGERTLAEIKKWASAKNMTLSGALQFIHRETIGHKELKITSKSRNALLQFWELIEGLRGLQNSETVGRVMEAVIERTDFKSYVQKLDNSEKSSKRRIERLSVLQNISDSSDYKYGTGPLALVRFLQEISFVPGQEDEMGEEGGNTIKLMTLHAAKGLEFDCVFIAGLQESLLPMGGHDLSEERRLFYVGVTRAMQRLYMTSSESSFIHGKESKASRSRFLDDIEGSEAKIKCIFD